MGPLPITRVAPKSRPKSKGPVALSELVGKAVDPVFRKRGFASHDLLACWPDIAGEPYGSRVQPERLIWPRRPKHDDIETSGEQATLVVHTDGPTALMLSHDSRQLIERLNTFLGWAAICRIKIVQRPVVREQRKKAAKMRPLTAAEQARLSSLVGGVENERLREALKKLGASVIAKGPGTGSRR